MKNNTIKKIIPIFVLVFVLFFIFYFSYFAYAEEYTLLAPLPLTGGELVTKITPANYVSGFIKLLIGIAAVLAVFMIVWGGFEYVLTEAVASKTDAKDRITKAILGLLLALSSYLILNTINPDLVNFRLDFKSYKAPATGGNQVLPPGVVANPPGVLNPLDGSVLSGYEQPVIPK